MTTAREETSHLADLLRREHHALAEFLVALAAFDRERRWVELGYSSLFYFLTRELGLPNGPAFYRKTATELLQRYPDLAEPLRDGRLNLSSVVELSKVITPENRGAVVPRFFGASKRAAKEVVAELQPLPVPPLRTIVTAVRAPDAATGSDACAIAFTAGALLPEEVPPCQFSITDGASAVSSASARAPDSAPVRSSVSGSAPGSHRSAVPGSATVSAVVPVPAPAPARRRASIEPLTAELRRIHLTAPKRLLEKLAAARDALSHSHPGASDDEVLELGLDLIIERHRKRRGLGAKPRKSPRGKASEAAVAAASALSTASGACSAPVSVQAPAPAQATATGTAAATPAAPGSTAPPRSSPPPPQRTRHVPAHVWRAVWERDGGRCVWPVDGGGVCGSTRRLQLDHIDGFALGAGTTVDECRLLCAWHNDLHARNVYGEAAMNRFTRSKGNRCSEAVAVYAGATPTFARSAAPA